MFNKKDTIEEVKINDKKLTINEYRQFIDCVVGSVLIDGELHLENLEPVFLMTVLDMFTSTPLINKEFDDTDIDTIPADQKKGKYQIIDFDATYNFCLDNNVLSQVKKVFGEDYIDRLYQDCIDTLEFKKDVVIHKASSVSDEIILSVTGLVNELKDSVAKFNPDNYKDVLPLIQKLNGMKLTQSKVVDTIVKNAKKDAKNAQKVASTQNNDDNVQNVVANEQKDNITPITSTIEG